MTYALDAGVAALFDIPAHLTPTTGLEPLDTKDQALMVWFKVDDSFYDHPKTEDLSDSAVALWTRAGSYSAKHLTDGFISHRKAARMCDNPEAAVAELVAAGLWVKEGDGYRFHDWHEYQPTREEALAASNAKSVGGAVGNHRRWHVERGRVDPKCPYCQAISHRSTDRITDQSSESPPNRPTRPDPTRPTTEHPSDVLFDAQPPAAPPQPTAKDTNTPPPEAITAQHIVAAFVDASLAAGLDKLTSGTKGKVARDAKRLLDKDKVDPRKLLEAATLAGENGWQNLDAVLRRMSADEAQTRRLNQGRRSGGLASQPPSRIRNSHDNVDRYDVKL